MIVIFSFVVKKWCTSLPHRMLNNTQLLRDLFRFCCSDQRRSFFHTQRSSPVRRSISSLRCLCILEFHISKLYPLAEAHFLLTSFWFGYHRPNIVVDSMDPLHQPRSILDLEEAQLLDSAVD